MRGPLFIAGFCVCLTIAAFESAVASPGRRCGGVSWRGPGSRTRLCGEGLGLSAPSVVCRGPRPVKKLRPHSPPRRPRLPEACAFCGQGSFSDVRSPPSLGHLLCSDVIYWEALGGRVFITVRKWGPRWGTEDTIVLFQPLALLGAATASGSDPNRNGFALSLPEAATAAAGLCADSGAPAAALTPPSPPGFLRERTGPARLQQEGAGLPLQVPVGPRALRGPALPAGEKLTADTLLAPPSGQGHPQGTLLAAPEQAPLTRCKCREQRRVCSGKASAWHGASGQPLGRPGRWPRGAVPAAPGAAPKAAREEQLVAHTCRVVPFLFF